jgi:Flp pilus assembly protein CpaB
VRLQPTRPRLGRRAPARRLRRRPRLALRTPALYWTATALLAVVTGVTTLAVVDHAHDEQAAWGDTEVVAVARRDLDAGTTIAGGDVAWEPRPLAVVPDGVVTQGTSVEGRVVVATTKRGEPLVDDRLAPGGATGLVALMPPDSRALTVPPSDRRLAAVIGDHVDVWRGAGRTGAEPAAAELVARSATVIDAPDDGSVTIAVRPDEAPQVAAAVVDGSVVLAITNR